MFLCTCLDIKEEVAFLGGCLISGVQCANKRLIRGQKAKLASHGCLVGNF